ncbi:MAG: hypothetical protein P4L69_13430 [Desulfosporosinus sp.]|nr:hypothetical protein [Desulfosporosinus sp.]
MGAFEGWAIKIALAAAVISTLVEWRYGWTAMVKVAIIEAIIVGLGVLANQAGHPGLTAIMAVGTILVVPAMDIGYPWLHDSYGCFKKNCTHNVV